MMYLHAALTIHEAGGKIDEDTVKKVLKDAGATPDEMKVKALIAALRDVDIPQVIKDSATMMTAAPAAGAAPAASGEKKEVKKDEDKKSDEQAAAGLGALFG